MGKYTIFLMFENPTRGRQTRNFSENDPKILDLKSSSKQIIFRKLSLGAPEFTAFLTRKAWSIKDLLNGQKETSKAIYSLQINETNED